MPKMGRPKSSNPKLKQLTVRLDIGTFQKLEELANALGKTRVDVLRMGIEELYNGQTKK